MFTYFKSTTNRLSLVIAALSGRTNYTTMSKDISSVADYFPHPEVEEVVGRPTYETLQMLREKLVANAAAIPSTLGGRAHGHSGLILTDAT